MQNFWQFLSRECRATPGRGSYTLRLTLSCAVLVTLFMTLQIPFLAVALIVVFYVSQPNVVMIKLAGIAFFVTISVALGGVLLIIKWTYDYPLIRLVASIALFFAAIYLMRVLGKLGLAFFVVALAVIYAQTFPSMTGQSEILVRLLMWLWVAINCAILVTLLVNACFPQAFPGTQFRRELARMFAQSAALLTAEGATAHRPTLQDLAGHYLHLQSLYKLACRSDAVIAANPQAWRSAMAAALRCYHLSLLFQPTDSPAVPPLALALTQVGQSLENGTVPTTPITLSPQTLSSHPECQQILATLNLLASGEAVPLPAGKTQPAPLLAPDAWSNPAYLHFALKTLLATLLCYVFYTAADWQGIHTIMLSCVIVAQPGLGATMQKTWLRIGGALLATVLALLLIVFVQPHTESLVGLLAMSLPVMALAAWLAAGSERIAYAGIQIGFTFALAFLNWFGPLANLTELRDRVIGILLGVLVSSIVHLYLWPDSEVMRLKNSLSRVFQLAGNYLGAKEKEREIVPLFDALPETDALIHRVAAEPLNTWAHPFTDARHWPARPALVQLQEIVRLGDGYRLHAQADDPFLAHCAAHLQDYSRDIGQPKASAPVPPGTASADPANPFALPLTTALAMLPDWQTTS